LALTSTQKYHENVNNWIDRPQANTSVCGSEAGKPQDIAAKVL
jgi:hypothetical protein